MEEKTADEEKMADENTKQIIIKNSDLEAMHKNQVRICDKCGNMIQQTGSLKWLISCRNLPVNFAFELKKIRLQIENINIPFHQQWQVLIEKYADRDEKGDLIQISPNVFSFKKNQLPFQIEFFELLSLESKLDGSRLKIDLEDMPDKFLSADDFATLECIIEFTKKKEK